MPIDDAGVLTPDEMYSRRKESQTPKMPEPQPEDAQEGVCQR